MTRLEQETVEYQGMAAFWAAGAMASTDKRLIETAQWMARLNALEAKWRLSVLVNLPGHMDEGF
jgi:hypothetical protein